MDSKQFNRVRTNGEAAGREDSRWMRERIAELETALSEAIEDIEDWAAYADDYFREKYDLQGCLEKHRAKINAQEKDDE